MTMTGIFGNAFSDAVLGSKRTDEKVLGVFGLGYRYAINRFKVGGDLGFGIASSKLAFAGQPAPSIKERDIHLLVLPTAEFSYFRRGLVELYGSERHSESGLTPEGKEMASAKSDFGASFAYQVNPIAVRVGNDRIGGFVEAGFGTKGFVTAGVSLGF